MIHFEVKRDNPILAVYDNMKNVCAKLFLRHFLIADFPILYGCSPILRGCSPILHGCLSKYTPYKTITFIERMISASSDTNTGLPSDCVNFTFWSQVKGLQDKFVNIIDCSEGAPQMGKSYAFLQLEPIKESNWPWKRPRHDMIPFGIKWDSQNVMIIKSQSNIIYFSS